MEHCRSNERTKGMSYMIQQDTTAVNYKQTAVVNILFYKEKHQITKGLS